MSRSRFICLFVCRQLRLNPFVPTGVGILCTYTAGIARFFGSPARPRRPSPRARTSVLTLPKRRPRCRVQTVQFATITGSATRHGEARLTVPCSSVSGLAGTNIVIRDILTTVSCVDSLPAASAAQHHQLHQLGKLEGLPTILASDRRADDAAGDSPPRLRLRADANSTTQGWLLAGSARRLTITTCT